MKRAAATLLLMLGLFAPALGLSGCADDCSTAQSLCEECELATDTCDRFEILDGESCTSAVAAYEASCPDS